jgi:hypothetical protein
MTDGIEIIMTRLPGGGMRADAQVPATVLATLRLVAIAGSGRHRGGHGVHVATAASPAQPAWARRGFIAGDSHDDLWRLVEKAAAWAANEAEKQS